MNLREYDIIIIGAGAAGLQLAMAMDDDKWFRDKRILLLDKDQKEGNDRTWCFWEEGKGKFDDILHHSWGRGWFHSKRHSIDLDMGNYRYKMIRSADFYTYAKNFLSISSNMEFRTEEAGEVHPAGRVITDKGEYMASYIFDSRIPEEFHSDQRSVKLLQHFLGWVIRTEEDTFDPDVFTMMDYRNNKTDACSFTYVLPFDSKTALVEFTLFSEHLLQDSEYRAYLENYVEKVIGRSGYEILETERGIIPMSDYDFEKHNQGIITQIGTGGGWVKPSSGYSFRNSGRYIEKLIENLKRGKSPQLGLIRSRSRLFDSIFLGILKQQNHRGEELFENMYHKLPVPLIFRFLDETSGFAEDLRVLSAYLNPTFIKAFFRRLFLR